MAIIAIFVIWSWLFHRLNEGDYIGNAIPYAAAISISVWWLFN